MQKKNSTVHLLILDPSQNEAEALVSLLRNSGRATRAHRITSEEDLEETLKSGNWDLLLARNVAGEEGFGPEQALAMIRRMDKDIPFVLLTEDFNHERTEQFLKAGAQDTVQSAHTRLLVLVVKRELAALEERRKRRALESHLRESEQRCRLLLESSKDAIAYINDGMHIYANQSYMEFLGYDDIDDLICIPILDTLSTESQGKYKEFMKSFAETGKDGMSLNCVARRSDDQELNITMSVSSATYDSEPCTQLVIQPEHSDAELEEKLRQISSQDLLTGLYNRQHFMDQLEGAVTKAKDHTESAALAYIELDNFMAIKGQLGIAGADLLLGDLSTILKNQTGEEMVLARLSDEAFGILAPAMEEKALVELCGKLCKTIEDHLFEIDGRTVQLTVSIGVAVITENAPNAADVLGRGHTAAAEVRKQEGHEGGNGVVAYNPVEAEGLGEGNATEAIQNALDDDRFRMLFQPIINLRGEGEEHYEATVRMVDKGGEEVSPYDILPPNGPSEMAVKIDRWVILQTIKQLAVHRSRGHDTKLFLNVSAETIQDKTFTSWLSVALKAARLPGDALIFQIREGDTTNYLKQAKEFVKGVHELHCKISLSQFGGAINPFNTLKHVDVDYVKIDGSFTEELQKNEETKEQVKEMVKTLQEAGKLTIIPMVENAVVLSTLWQAGVNYIQGYYVQAPVAEMNYDFGDQQ
ncbi:EAL domain-containing response regulator [Marinobacter zhejiangensis]|uniref:Diguanylate cyclase/phosphodiesterase n=1 Tax=Marinobacter zhejiangensis TaxID=488535 RepID=A0A1I4QH21_9GAMM|nr:EAL domain-containing protein [Marinobacter zhejiangensis]SFM39401.1 diguanylate cyclase/phosphodiesterase [Marinobacter zhejiangensis]